MNVQRVLLAQPRGFCAGVEKAIKALDWMTRVFSPPVYCYHEIVHNRFVVEHFEALGVIFVDSIETVPLGSPLMLSAHGSPPSVVESARRVGGTVIDAVCPLVTKVHHEMKVRTSKGYRVIYVGHEGHEEAIGTMAVAPESSVLVETPEDVDRLSPFSGPVALLSQTTLSFDEWSEVRRRVEEKFPEVWTPNRSDLCFATTNRQTALRSIAGSADTVVVIGSQNSSNTVALTKVASGAGAKRVLRVNSADELPSDLSGVIAVTAGASAPESLVNAVLEHLAPTEGIEIHTTSVEDEYFPPPPELREMLRALSGLLDVALGAQSPSSFDAHVDREFTAGQVLSVSH